MLTGKQRRSFASLHVLAVQSVRPAQMLRLIRVQLLDLLDHWTLDDDVLMLAAPALVRQACVLQLQATLLYAEALPCCYRPYRARSYFFHQSSSIHHGRVLSNRQPGCLYAPEAQRLCCGSTASTAKPEAHLAALCRILGSCPEATVAALDRSEALGSLAQAIRVQQRDGLPPDLWLPEAVPPVSPNIYAPLAIRHCTLRCCAEQA